MRIESCVTSISWIPFASIEGITGFPFSIGLCHYDDPPPQRLDMVQQRNGADRFVNELRAWVSVEDGRIADYGHSGGGYVGVTKVSFGPEIIALPGIHLPILQRPPKILGTSVRFVQTVGGRTALPAPRRSVHRPFFQVAAPAAWTTLALTLHADGSTEHELTGPALSAALDIRQRRHSGPVQRPDRFRQLVSHCASTHTVGMSMCLP
jgi:hypothetical protein